MLFKKMKNKNSTKELTAKLAQEIYTAIAENGTWQKAFTAKETNFDLSNLELVWNEIKKLEAEVMQKMSGSYQTKAEIPAVYDEKGEITSPAIPAEYYKPSTEKDLAESLKSTLLDTAVLVLDIRRYSDGNPDSAPDWKTWLESFDTEM